MVSAVGRGDDPKRKERPVRFLPPSKPPTGPAPPRRSVCAPAAMSLHSHADQSRNGESYVVPSLSPGLGFRFHPSVPGSSESAGFAAVSPTAGGPTDPQLRIGGQL